MWHRPLRSAVTVIVLCACLLLSPRPAKSYSVLTHEAIIDTLWLNQLKPILLKRFPQASDDDLVKAHAYAYGGCIIQDLGYYPFGSRFFSDLAHYVRSADFVQALLDDADDLDGYAFALGAVAHYGADVEGHSIAVNRAVPILFPDLRRKFGSEVTYADDPKSHLKTEFGFDVLQVSRGHYAPEAYHDFIGFSVKKNLLERAFAETYGLEMKDLFKSVDLALGTYRFSVRTMLPTATRAAWQLKKSELEKQTPGISRAQFQYNLSRASYEKEWGRMYDGPGLGARVIAFLFRLLPKAAPFRGLAFRVPTPQTERMFEDSFNASVRRDVATFGQTARGDLNIRNRDLDTGRPVSAGEYELTDETYDKLLRKLADNKFQGVSTDLQNNIKLFYSNMKTADRHGIGPQLDALKSFKITAPAATP